MTLLAILVACGTPATQPAEPTYEPTPRYIKPFPDAAVRPDAVVLVDAGVAVVEVDAAVVAEAPVEPPGEYVDGIPILRIPARQWCDDKLGICHDNPKSCAASKRGPCRRVDSWACGTYTRRTSGKRELLCMTTHAECDEFTDGLARHAEISSVEPCVIFRYDPKAKL